MSQSSAVKTCLTTPGLMISSVTVFTWLLVCVVYVLLLVWCIAIFGISIVLLFSLVAVSIVLVVVDSIVIV